MQTVTSNTPQQINSALFALDRNIKNIEGNMDLQTQILNEAQTRSNADTALANSINNVSSELSQAQLIAYAYGASGSAATDVTQIITISGATSYNAAAGSRVLVSFPNGYTPSNEDSALQLQIGNMAALPALAQGVAMKYGSVPAGAMIEFTYTGSAWCCQSNIVKATSDYTLYADGNVTYNYVYQRRFGNISWYNYQTIRYLKIEGCSLGLYRSTLIKVLSRTSQVDIIVNFYDGTYYATKNNAGVSVYLDGSTLYVQLEAWSLNYEVYYDRTQGLSFSITDTYSGSAV